MKNLLFILLILFAIPLPVQAQEGGQSRPESLWLEGIQQHYQLYNRCSAAALATQLSYFDWPGSHTQVAQHLNHNPSDVSVRIEEMAAFAEAQDLRAIYRTGGTMALLMDLVAGGFPVLIETAYYDANDSYDDWMSHNRVVMGYEDWPQETLYLFDPLIGNGEDGMGLAMPFYELDARWRHFNRDYLVLYRPEQEEALQAILGDQWDITFNAESTLHQAMEDREVYGDAFAVYNIGSAQLMLGQYEEAAANFDLAREMGLPKRMFWYRFEAFEAYLYMGRYEDTRALVYEVLNATDGVDEMYYYIARAYEGLGNVERARANYSAALYRNPYYVEAQRALERMDG